MDTNFEQKVRERAYEIWMSAGMADGKAHEHWVIAEQAVANETGEPVKASSVKKASATKVLAIKAAAPAKKPAVKKAPAKAAKPSAPKATSKASQATH